MLKRLDSLSARHDPAYAKLSGSGQQGVDLWLDNMIAWADVPDDARAFLKRHGEGHSERVAEILSDAATVAQEEMRQALAQVRSLAERIPDADTIAEEFANLSREIADAKAIKRGKKPEVNVWSAGEQLNAVKYAREQGFITAAEAQKLTRKLLRLPGKRGIADAKQSRLQARKGR